MEGPYRYNPNETDEDKDEDDSKARVLNNAEEDTLLQFSGFKTFNIDDHLSIDLYMDELKTEFGDGKGRMICRELIDDDVKVEVIETGERIMLKELKAEDGLKMHVFEVEDLHQRD
jgi:hypothetical protein